MEIKRYSSYKEIDAALEILKLEKEINYQKMVLNAERAIENLSPLNIIKGFLGSYKEILYGSYKELLSGGIKFLIK